VIDVVLEGPGGHSGPARTGTSGRPSRPRALPPSSTQLLPPLRAPA